jgi:hypothetical protein
MSLENIPQALRDYPQWVLWRLEDLSAPKPIKIPYSVRTGRHASVTDRKDWGTYRECYLALQSGNYSGLGFVLSDEDPFAFIDLDDTKGNFELVKFQMEIAEHFKSYSEISPSGKGLHIIVKGKVASGRRQKSVEVYSAERYMTMTGNVWGNLPVTDCNESLNQLWQSMGKAKSNTEFYIGTLEEKETDFDILNNAANAKNGDKFKDLYLGKWQDYYSSQSEADFALIDIIAFYTQNRKQIVRIFHDSALGKRDKAKRSDYIGWMLNRCFDNLLPPVDTDHLKNKLNEIIAEKIKSQDSTAKDVNPIFVEGEVIPKANSIYTVPPGLVGEIAQFVYAQAPRPVPEIALAGAIALMAGIVGRSYNISGTGLNLYTLLLAPTGTGKEAIASGIDKLMNAVVKTVPAANDFVGPGEIASSQAILKYMSKGPTSFVSMVGEFGIYLQQMASINAPPHLMGLRRFLLDAYNKSGEGKILRPSIYSDKQNNTHAVLSPAFSLMGESTPEKFYEGLHEGLISEGLLPRFTMIEYKGLRPELNENHLQMFPSFQLVDKFASICAHSLMLNSQNKSIAVRCNSVSEKIFKDFNSKCDDYINKSGVEIKRHLWNRAHIKALKLAALIAVGCNSFDPVITEENAKWAIAITEADVKNLLGRFDAGEIGIDNDEVKQIAKVIEAIKGYVISPWQDVAKYAGEGFSNLHSARIIPYAYIQRVLASISIFRKDKLGSTNAIKRAIKNLIERGDLVEIGKSAMQKDYGTSCLSYMISKPKSFGL